LLPNHPAFGTVSAILVTKGEKSAPYDDFNAFCVLRWIIPRDIRHAALRIPSIALRARHEIIHTMTKSSMISSTFVHAW
jgi:hypothetical protein